MISLLATLSILSADVSWYEEKPSGWYFGEPEEEKLSAEEAAELLELSKQKFEELQALAIISPTKENMARYKEELRRINHNSLQFAEAWTSNEHCNPNLSKRYFLLFCFHGEDAQSLASANAANEFALSSGWILKSVSLDGTLIQGLKCEIDQGISKHLPSEKTPAFYAVDPAEETVILLGIGLRTSDEIRRSILEKLV